MLNIVRNKNLLHRVTYLLVLLCLLVVLFLLGCDQFKVHKYYESGVIASVSPIASEAGLSVLRSGGNAFDAAVTVGFVLAVVHPQAGNLGGGGFALLRQGSTGDVLSLDFREKAPASATEKMYLDDSGKVRSNGSTIGALSVGVPGTVAGLHLMWEKYGSVAWEKLIYPAAALADSGFIIDSFLAEDFLDYRDSLTLFEETEKLFRPDGRTLVAGDRLVQKELAQTLFRLAAEGPDYFYKGDIADLIDSCMKKHGGLITKEDLASYSPVWRKPVEFTFDSLQIFSMPPPSSGGIAVGQILKLIEPFDLSPYSTESSGYINLFCQAARLAFADRSEHLGDGDFYQVPENLLESSYLSERRKLMHRKTVPTSQEIHPGSPSSVKTESEETTHFSIADRSGNMVAITTTLNGLFGSKLAVDGGGFLLNNEMDDFSIKPGYPNSFGLIGGEANKIESGKRMLSSMSPTIVLLHDRPLMITGSPGGSKIISTVAQSIIAYSRFGMQTDEIVSAPRFHHQWLPDKLYLEENKFSVKTRQALIRLGYNIKDRKAYGDLEIILFDQSGLMQAASDPRNGGAVRGY